MNENINLVEILKDCPRGTELYSAIHGKVFFWSIDERTDCLIKVYRPKEGSFSFSKEGKAFRNCEGECVLFPSKEQRDWSKFKVSVKRFNPENFKPFDKVLVKFYPSWDWTADIVSYYRPQVREIITVNRMLFTENIVPYNEETCNLVGTTNDCPEYYKWWKE